MLFEMTPFQVASPFFKDSESDFETDRVHQSKVNVIHG